MTVNVAGRSVIRTSASRSSGSNSPVPVGIRMRANSRGLCEYGSASRITSGNRR